MSHALFKGPDRDAQINGPYRISNPPLRSSFNGGGGGGSKMVIMQAQLWTVQDGARKSTVYNGYRTPPSVLPLMEGGGVRDGYNAGADLGGSKQST
jgi:hypothetical protein